MQAAQTRGLIIGLVLGIVWAWLGFGAALLTGILGASGWFIGNAIGAAMPDNFNVTDLWNDLQNRRRAQP